MRISTRDVRLGFTTLSTDRHPERDRAACGPIDKAPADEVQIDRAARDGPAQARLPPDLALVAGEGLDHQVEILPERDLRLRAHEYVAQRQAARMPCCDMPLSEQFQSISPLKVAIRCC